MFRRTFWFTAGAAAGVWASHKVNQKLQRLTPESLAAQAADKALDTGHRIKDFALDVRAGMLQREAELDDVLGLNAPPRAPGCPPRAGRRWRGAVPRRVPRPAEVPREAPEAPEQPE
ncbi:hypothetical protein OIM90_28210 [Streptomyces sp. AD16]|nr:hypothetical protein OIM90_28210 [Streptomyces sp. AD16]